MASELPIPLKKYKQLCGICDRLDFEFKKDKVKRLLKGEFERIHGMSFDEFISIYNHILETSPEEFI